MNYFEIKNKYQKLGKVFCPYLKRDISFNAKGFRHLMYKNHIRKRSEQEVEERASYFQSAKDVLSVTTTLQEKEMHPETELLKESVLFGFIAILENIKLKIIVKKDGEGGWYFFSVIPNYITSPKRDNSVTSKKPA